MNSEKFAGNFSSENHPAESFWIVDLEGFESNNKVECCGQWE